jgi:lysyl-tRNA synthetase class 1
MATDERLDDWVTEMADEVVAAAERRGVPVVVASGLSPSGPVHLGNLREVLTPHLVADEIRRRGIPCRHLLSWDDFDRLRKVPVGVDPSWSEHIGKPLSRVPAPPGSSFATWAEHFEAPMTEAMAALGIEVDPVSQTEMYTSGAYLGSIVTAMRARTTIDGILAPHRTKQAAADSVEDGDAATGYYPYRPYCAACGRDTTTVTSYDEEYTLTYVCQCGHEATVDLRTDHDGKLVWKVDWPMRWAFERVVFEPSGVDHQSPGSSFAVGKPIVEQVFGGERPIGPMYAFVGDGTSAKMSSSKGAVPTAGDALEIMEPAVLRWVFARRRPKQSFDIVFGPEHLRLYDEWDATNRKVAEGGATPNEAAALTRAATTAAGPLPSTPRPLPFKTITSIVDVTADDPAQLLRILGMLDPTGAPDDLGVYEPRLTKARNWVHTRLPDESRTIVRDAPATDVLASLGPEDRSSLERLVAGLGDDWSLAGVERLVYGVPKLALGLDLDAPADADVKKAQREFFKLLYRLLVDAETGPRLPTLLLAIGLERARLLLTP